MRARALGGSISRLLLRNQVRGAPAGAALSPDDASASPRSFYRACTTNVLSTLPYFIASDSEAILDRAIDEGEITKIILSCSTRWRTIPDSTRHVRSRVFGEKTCHVEGSHWHNSEYTFSKT